MSGRRLKDKWSNLAGFRFMLLRPKRSTIPFFVITENRNLQHLPGTCRVSFLLKFLWHLSLKEHEQELTEPPAHSKLPKRQESPKIWGYFSSCWLALIWLTIIPQILDEVHPLKTSAKNSWVHIKALGSDGRIGECALSDVYLCLRQISARERLESPFLLKLKEKITNTNHTSQQTPLNCHYTESSSRKKTQNVLRNLMRDEIDP